MRRSLAGRAVNPLGLGCMNINHAYKPFISDDEGVRLIHEALALGVDHVDTAALYGFGRNEEVVGRALKGRRSEVFLASKCGMFGVDGKRVIDGRPEGIKATLEGALTRLGTDHIDLYYLHRWDRAVPIEESVGALADLVKAGHIGAIGLSEVSADMLRQAQAVHPIAAVQSEYSLWTREAEIAVLEACRELGAAFVAFSPLARGFLGQRLDPAQFEPSDLRVSMPRFQAPNLAANLRLYDELETLAKANGLTSAQLSLAWVLAQGEHVHVIPGTRSEAHLRENMATTVPDASVLARAGEIINRHTVSGERYAPATLAEIDTERFAN